MTQTTLRKWLIGGAVAVASGLSDVFVLGFVDPNTFNLANLGQVGLVAAIFGVKAGLFYVRDHGKELAE